MYPIIRETIRFLGLKRHYEIVLSRKEKRAHTALYQPGIREHFITVYLGNLTNKRERSLETLVVHELIHAWQEEKGFTSFHGPDFQKMARALENHFLSRQVYTVKDIWIPHLDGHK